MITGFRSLITLITRVLQVAVFTVNTLVHAPHGNSHNNALHTPLLLGAVGVPLLQLLHMHLCLLAGSKQLSHNNPRGSMRGLEQARHKQSASGRTLISQDQHLCLGSTCARSGHLTISCTGCTGPATQRMQALSSALKQRYVREHKLNNVL